jgi:hypothetical protein|tara:strand:- start:729 stop:992 length:264 start_codon:yes stop_codon:yes gene_type:complete
MSNNQESLFGDLDKYSWWDKEWQDMPEYKMEDESPFQSINIHFKTQEDRDEFSKLVNQTITQQTKYIWFPKKDELPPRYFLYVDEEE